MAIVNAAAMRGDRVTDWGVANPDINPSEIVIANNDSTGEPEYLAIAKKIPASPTVKTPFNSCQLFPLFTQTERDKLATLEALEGSDIVSLLLGAGFDLEAMSNGTPTNASSIISLLNAYFAVSGQEPTTASPTWFRIYCARFNGRDPDPDGDIFPEQDDYAVADISGLVDALAGKAASSHGHALADITDLVSSLAAKLAITDFNALVGVADGLATLGSDGKLTTAQVPDSVGNLVTSVFGRTGDVVKVANDYVAADIGFTPSSFIAGTNVQTALAELIGEVIPLTQKGAASGICDLDSDTYVPTSRLRPADTAFTFSERIYWKETTSNETINLADQEVSSQTRRFSVDMAGATTMFMSCYVTTANTVAGAKWRVQYAVSSDSYTAWTDTGAEILFDGTNGTGQLFSTPVSVPAGAKTTTTRLRLMSSGGNGSAVSTTGMLGCIINYSVPINTGSMSASAISAALDGLHGTGWRDTASDNSIALAKLVNASGARIIGALTSGAWQSLTDTQVKTLLGLPATFTSSFNTRTGAVTAQSGDYTADQITDTGAKVLMTVAERGIVTRFNSRSVQTSSASGVFGAVLNVFLKATSPATFTLTNDNNVTMGIVRNFSAVAHNIVPASGQTLRNALGTSVASISIPPASGALAPSSMCFVRDIDNSWWLG